MKTIRIQLLGSLASMLMILSCQKNLQEEISAPPSPSVQSNLWGSPDAYNITLESHRQEGANWVWIWSVQNPNPGNGNNGTVQPLCHWGIYIDGWVDLGTIVSSSHSADSINWTGFTPINTVDNSQDCMMDPVLKFPFGTTGSNKSYYKLVLNYDYPEGTSTGYYKSGNRTRCSVFKFPGILTGDESSR